MYCLATLLFFIDLLAGLYTFCDFLSHLSVFLTLIKSKVRKKQCQLCNHTILYLDGKSICICPPKLPWIGIPLSQFCSWQCSALNSSNRVSEGDSFLIHGIFFLQLPSLSVMQEPEIKSFLYENTNILHEASTP